MVRVGVTGATGFIGGALIPRLASRRYDLTLVDNRTGPVRVEYPEWSVPNMDFASDAALRMLSDCDVVLHLAAVSGVMLCAQDPTGSAAVNVAGTRRLFEMCGERRIPFAFASSFAVVGAPERLPVREDTPARPTHEYARQKAAGEVLAASVATSGRASTAILRMSNVYGGYEVQGRRVAKGNVLELFARQAREGRLTVNSPGTQRRDFVHIDDVVAHWEATVGFLRRATPPPRSSVISVASGESFSVQELAERILRAFATSFPDRPVPKVEVVPNPRKGVELVEPAFSVDRTGTDRLLGISCRHRVERELPEILRAALAG